MLYLELGVIPIRFIIKSRRLNFLKYLLDQSSETLVNKVLVAQLTNPTRNDWGQTIKHDLEEIGLEIDDVNNMTKKNFRTFVRNKTEAMAFEYLTDKKHKHKKVRKFYHNNLKMP